MERQKVIISENIGSTLENAIGECIYDRLFVLADENTSAVCLPQVRHLRCMEKAHYIIIKPADTNKNLETLAYVWSELGRMGATRHSLMVNIGGGMVTDLGGFAASTFKRGIAYINIPTTLLAMVDASVGGKTGINFNGLKNEIGIFNNARSVIIDTVFLKTMNRENMLSGYAEMVKHGLISDTGMWAEIINFDIENPDLDDLRRMVAESVAVKERIVGQDPHERGLRKALNFGHTAGHAFESFAMTRHPVLHGYAVAYGIIAELYLSAAMTGFPAARMHQTVDFIRSHYGRMGITCDDYQQLYEFMTHDKKNVSGTINFTLLSDIGDIRIDQTASREDIFNALDFYAF